MPIERGVWRIEKATGSGPTEALAKLPSAKFDDELRLERLLAVQPHVLGSDLLAIGRQVITPTEKRADILAIDPAGELYVIELKKDRTPQEAIAQLLDCDSWASKLTHEQLLAIYEDQHADVPFEQAFAKRFGGEGTLPESLNL